jgi:hypothetical protein
MAGEACTAGEGEAAAAAIRSASDGTAPSGADTGVDASAGVGVATTSSSSLMEDERFCSQMDAAPLPQTADGGLPITCACTLTGLTIGDTRGLPDPPTAL